uniref:SOWAHA-C winged helix-turn-helix domain-containing protein n=1 Tax=Aceria tosichella TaxID=561515 RepID=A0A6G1S571_9ACAR
MSTMLDINLIRDYLIAVGCRVQYPILVNAFKKYLCHPDPIVQGKVRTKFKDFVNRLATVNVENNMKFITLKLEFRPQHRESSLQPNKKWAIEACNYNKLLALLRKDPKLAPCKDIMYGT